VWGGVVAGVEAMREAMARRWVERESELPSLLRRAAGREAPRFRGVLPESEGEGSEGGEGSGGLGLGGSSGGEARWWAPAARADGSGARRGRRRGSGRGRRRGDAAREWKEMREMVFGAEGGGVSGEYGSDEGEALSGGVEDDSGALFLSGRSHGEGDESHGEGDAGDMRSGSEDSRGGRAARQGGAGGAAGARAAAGRRGRLVRKHFPAVPGAVYDFPSALSVARAREQRRREAASSLEGRLLGGRALADVLPACLPRALISDADLLAANASLHVDAAARGGRLDAEALCAELQEAHDEATDALLAGRAVPGLPGVDPQELRSAIEGEMAALRGAAARGEGRFAEAAEWARGAVWDEGYDLNQFGRPYDPETLAFQDGHFFDWAPPAQERLWSAARRGCADRAELEALLAAGALVDAYDPAWNRVTALHYAAWRGHRGTCALLLDLGANVSARATDGSTPLHLAALWGHVGLVQLLLARGADPWARRGFQDLRTPLDVAISYNAREWDPGPEADTRRAPVLRRCCGGA
jgi:hypothetical protein